MRIVLLGATGASGREVINEAIERGVEVVAVVRNPDALSDINNKLLQPVKANIFNADDLASKFDGVDGVVSCLGYTRRTWCSSTPVTFYSETAMAITAAMRKANIKRLVVMSAWYTQPHSEDPCFIKCLIRPCLLKKVYNDMHAMEEYLKEECSDMEFTSARCAILTNDPTKGGAIRVGEGTFIPNISKQMPRRDVARFMLDCVQNRAYINQCVPIGV